MSDVSLTEEYREQIYETFGNAMLKALEQAQITVEDSKASAGFMLGLEDVKTLTDALTFLDKVRERYPAYIADIERIKKNIYQTLMNLGAVNFSRINEKKTLGEEKWRRKVVMVEMVIKDDKPLEEVAKLFGVSYNDLLNWVHEEKKRKLIERELLSGWQPPRS